MTDPVVFLPSRSLCAWAASLSAYLWLAGIFTAPEGWRQHREGATREARHLLFRAG